MAWKVAREIDGNEALHMQGREANCLKLKRQQSSGSLLRMHRSVCTCIIIQPWLPSAALE